MIAICSNFQDLVMRASLQVSMITVPTRLKISTSEKFEMKMITNKVNEYNKGFDQYGSLKTAPSTNHSKIEEQHIDAAFTLNCINKS